MKTRSLPLSGESARLACCGAKSPGFGEAGPDTSYATSAIHGSHRCAGTYHIGKLRGSAHLMVPAREFVAFSLDPNRVGLARIGPAGTDCYCFRGECP